MLEEPDDAVAESHLFVLLDCCVEVGIKREDLSILNVVSNLPAQTAARTQSPDTLVDDGPLPFQVILERLPRLVGLADVVRRRGDHELKFLAWDTLQEFKGVCVCKQNV